MGPLSYVYGYRGGIGRRGVGQDTTGNDGIEIRARDGRYELVLWRCAAGFVPKSAIWTMDDGPMWVSGKTADLTGKNLSAIGCAWAVPGGIPSGWGQFGAVKKWALLIGRPRCQLNAL